MMKNNNMRPPQNNSIKYRFLMHSASTLPYVYANVEIKDAGEFLKI
jgi:hypothetical protein